MVDADIVRHRILRQQIRIFFGYAAGCELKCRRLADRGATEVADEGERFRASGGGTIRRVPRRIEDEREMRVQARNTAPECAVPRNDRTRGIEQRLLARRGP